MAKLTLSSLTSILGNEPSAISTLNQNFSLIETAVENTLSRDGDLPNELGDDLDINNFRIFNLPAPVSSTEPVRLEEFTDFQQDVTDTANNAAAAIAARAGAETAETNAETAEVNAEASEELARQWATEDEDTLIIDPNGNGYSSRHWAIKSSESAAGVNLPAVEPGDAGKVLRVNDTEDGQEYITGVTVTSVGVYSGLTFDSANNTFTLDLSEASLTGTLSEFNAALSDDDFASLTNAVTLTNKSVDLSSNTLTGTLAEFNVALSDDNFVSLTGSETLTNKTLTSPTINSPTIVTPSITGNTTTTGLFDGRDVAADGTKLDLITVTQDVDLDTIEARVNDLDASVILRGGWDASIGSFPGGGIAQEGDSYIVTTGGTVDSTSFNVNDRVVAITDNASTSVYADEWLKLDYTDQVLSVNTQTGAVVLDADDISDAATSNKFTSQTEIDKLAAIEANADVTDASNVGTAMTAATAITDLADTDEFGVLDASDAQALKPITWSSIKSEIVSEMAGSSLQAYSVNVLRDAIEFVIDGGGSAITSGIKGDLEVPWACTINRATALADQSGSVVVDLWVDTYANFPPTDADSITSSAPVTITTDTDSQDSTLTGWSTSLSAGDVIRFNVDSASTVERVTISLAVTKT